MTTHNLTFIGSCFVVAKTGVYTLATVATTEDGELVFAAMRGGKMLRLRHDGNTSSMTHRYTGLTLDEGWEIVMDVLGVAKAQKKSATGCNAGA